MDTWRLRLEYDGTDFSGWQVQPGQTTIQGEVESALQRVFAQPGLRVVASGRTDAGVHALGQVVSFRARAARQPSQVRDGLNSLLPPQIACLQADQMPAEFHAQRSAVGKLYRYVLRVGPARTALRRNRCWQVRYSLDVMAMAEALERLVGRHDFTSFRAAGCSANSPVRTIASAEIRPMEDTLWVELYGEGFLRHMVRNIVGSLHEVGRHNHSPEWFSELLEAKDRTAAGVTAPPQGLFLVRVDYPR